MCAAVPHIRRECVTLEIKALTDVGRIRKINEDSMYVFKSEDYAYAIVADGMGGHLAGEIASAMSVEKISNYIEDNINDALDRFQVTEIIRQAFLNANTAIFNYSCDNDSAMGMGTTTTLAMIRKGYIIYAHVGDSRAYTIGDSITQITRDHSYVQELVKLGQITPEQAKHHPRRNFITRAMGVEPDIRVDTGIKPYGGEKVLLCSDGLHGEIEDSELYEIISTSAPDEAVRRLVDMANERGGKDNITAIVMEGEID